MKKKQVKCENEKLGMKRAGGGKHSKCGKVPNVTGDSRNARVCVCVCMQCGFCENM